MNRLLRCCAKTLALLLAILLLPVSPVWAANTMAANTTIAAGAAPYPLLASIRPIALLAQEVGEGLPLNVDTLLPAGTSTHDFALSPSDLLRVHNASLLVWLGPTVEPYLAKLMTPGASDVRWEELPGLTRLPFRAALHDDEADHAHDQNEKEADPDQHHDHDTWDPHLWWSVGNALPLARALAQRIGADRPDWIPHLQQNLHSLEQRLRLQLTQQRQHLGLNTPPFLLAHDAFFYLEEDLGIRSEAALVLDPENRPGLQHLLELKQRVTKQQIHCVLTGAIVPDSLIDKIDGKPPLRRVSVDELGWDYTGAHYSDWLAQTYGKLSQCLQ